MLVMLALKIKTQQAILGSRAAIYVRGDGALLDEFLPPFYIWCMALPLRVNFLKPQPRSSVILSKKVKTKE